MAPEILMEQETAELQAIAQRIRDWQQSRKLSDKELERQMAGIGSTKTYQRILRGDLAELDVERQLANYRSVLALIESLASRAAGDEEVYEDLTPVAHLRSALVEILEERGNARVILMEGDTGMGKTMGLRALQARYGQRILAIEACDAWDDSAMALLGSILAALGVAEQPLSAVGRLEKVTRKLRERRVAVVIDEAHHLGAVSLNTIKSLVNQTPGEFVLLAMPTLWRRIERKAWEEVRQLTGNRLADRIKLDGLQARDVAKLLERRAGVTDPRACKLVAEHAPRYGNLAFVREVCRRLAAARPDAAPGIEDVAAAVKAEIASR